ncbi:MAG: ABC transporter permease [Clostridiales Family XIII bacterium]|jgi:NitT/TauT family transport system permease protein|nr:ABC transporter permease [Clostridiales Family XIII bacterium]
MHITRLKQFYTRSIAIILFFLLWDFSARFGLVDQFILPTVTQVIEAFGRVIGNGTLWGHFSLSMRRTGSGFLVAVVVAIPLGIVMGWFAKAEEYLDPLLQLFRNTSILAMFPVFILAFGLGELSKSAIVFWGCLWAPLINTIAGVKGVDPILIKSARSMGISVLGLFAKVILPACLPEILTGIRLAAGTGVIILVAAEMLGASRGLGYWIFYAQQRYATAEMYAGIVTISLIGVAINFILAKLEKHIVAWKRQMQ